MRPAFAAVDLGATSGRVMLAVLHDDAALAPLAGAGAAGPRVELVETGRFVNGAVTVPTTAGGDLHWDVLHLGRGITDGLREAGRIATERGAELAGIGVDSWAVDYALLDDAGALLATPRCYRDPRYLPAADDVDARIPAPEQYAIHGLQRLPFTTIYQLAANAADPAFAAASDLLLIPDLITCWLTGERVAEVTNASTTGLLDATTRTWSDELLQRLGKEYPALARLGDLLPRLVEPGTVVGALSATAQELTGLGPVPVVAVASHDTASAVVGTPLPARSAEGTAAYISSGTWSLVGLELQAPVLTEASRAADFTNELGLDGTVRYLHNVMGLWVFDECRRQWERDGEPAELAELLEAAAAEPGGVTIVDLDDPAFLEPGDMPARFREAAAAAGQPVPQSRAALARAVLDSLAAAYARTIAAAGELAGVTITQVNVVGGGSRNELLCRLTAEATGLPVVAGPTEAAALGNVLVQARAVGALPPEADLAALRAVVAASSELVTTTPDAAREKGTTR